MISAFLFNEFLRTLLKSSFKIYDSEGTLNLKTSITRAKSSQAFEFHGCSLIIYLETVKFTYYIINYSSHILTLDYILFDFDSVLVNISLNH